MLVILFSLTFNNFFSTRVLITFNTYFMLFQAACLLLPGELAKHAVSEGTKAVVTEYNRSGFLFVCLFVCVCVYVFFVVVCFEKQSRSKIPACKVYLTKSGPFLGAQFSS